MRIDVFTFALVTGLVAAACGSKNPAGDDDIDAGFVPDACSGLECQVVDCSVGQKPPTSISGRVFAPNGTLPLYGINVYVPRDDPGPFTEGAVCDKCSTVLPGNPLAQTVTDENGNFTLSNVPAGDNINIYVTIGKWRRKHTIARVTSCSDNPVPDDAVRLPKTKAEGDMPKIALTTGGADSLECLIRKLGIDDTEITNSAGAGRIHYYQGTGGVVNFKAGFGGGTAPMTSATPFWASVDSLKAYDIVFLSCEGSHNPGTKPQQTLDAMKAYADLGGRVFASHWHNVWIGGHFQAQQPPAVFPPVWNSVANWRPSDTNTPGNPILIDEVSNPKGARFATWMQNVGGSTVRDEIPLRGGTGRATTINVDAARVEKWVNTSPTNVSSPNSPQMFQFTTPNEDIVDNRCGKVVFTDMHVSGTSTTTNAFPDSCPGGGMDMSLSEQEKALAFMFFDIASCVGGVF